MKFKVGDKVIHKSDKRRFCIASSFVLGPPFGYYYCFSNLDEENGSQTSAQSDIQSGEVFFEKQLELDRQWYRNQKIKSLLE